MKEVYNKNKKAKVGDKCKCPSCKSEFIKKNYQQAFCRTRKGTICKDFYWNNIIPEKRNNKTRISPASKEWLMSKFDSTHRFSNEAFEY